MSSRVSHRGSRARDELQKLWDSELFEHERQSFVADIDGVAGSDTVVFANGLGDGGLPSIAGYGRSGGRAAIVLLSLAMLWRLAFPEGEPPPQISAREDTLAACLAKKRRVDGLRCRRLAG